MVFLRTVVPPTPRSLNKNARQIIQNSPPNDVNAVNKEPLVRVKANGSNKGNTKLLLIPREHLSNTIKKMAKNNRETKTPDRPKAATPSHAMKFAFAFNVGIPK